MESNLVARLVRGRRFCLRDFRTVLQQETQSFSSAKEARHYRSSRYAKCLCHLVVTHTARNEHYDVALLRRQSRNLPHNITKLDPFFLNRKNRKPWGDHRKIN